MRLASDPLLFNKLKLNTYTERLVSNAAVRPNNLNGVRSTYLTVLYFGVTSIGHSILVLMSHALSLYTSTTFKECNNVDAVQHRIVGNLTISKV